MILKGKDLIVSCDGNVIAAAKTCSLTVEADDVAISSPATGAWKKVVCGEKSWSVSTNHLMPNPTPQTWDVRNNTVEATVPSHAEISSSGARATVRVANRELAIGSYTRGLYIFDYYMDNGQWTTDRYGPYDTYASDEDIASFIEDLNGLSGNERETVIIVSHDAFRMTQDMREAIESKLAVNIATIPLVATADGTAIGAIAIIGQPDFTDAVGSCVASMGRNGSAHIKMCMVPTTGQLIVLATPLRDAVAYVGKKFTLSLRVASMPGDILTGTALCKQFKVNSNLGNLMQGSFSWAGDGPLT